MHARPLSRHRRRRHRRRHHQRRHGVASWPLVCACTPDSGLVSRPPPKMPTRRHRRTNGRRRRPRQTRARQMEPRRKRRKGKRATCRIEEKREKKENKIKKRPTRAVAFALCLFLASLLFSRVCAREPKKREAPGHAQDLAVPRRVCQPVEAVRGFSFFFFRVKCVFFSVGKKRPPNGRRRRPASGCLVPFLFSLSKIKKTKQRRGLSGMWEKTTRGLGRGGGARQDVA